MFKTFLKHILEIHGDKDLIEDIEYQNVLWSYFVKKGRILARFRSDFQVGQIVSQVFENFSQILIISTLIVPNFDYLQNSIGQNTFFPHVCL